MTEEELKVKKNKLIEFRNKLKKEKKMLAKITPEIETLLENEKVKRHEELRGQRVMLDSGISNIDDEAKYLVMEVCDHVFVINEKISVFDGHRTDTKTVVTCLKCDVTNRYIEDFICDYDTSFYKINQAFKHNGGGSIIGKFEYDEVKTARELYFDYLKHNREASNEGARKYLAKEQKRKRG